MTLRKKGALVSFAPYQPGTLAGEHRYRARTLPAAGALPRPEDQGEQLTL